MLKLFKNHRGQSTLEYAVLIVIVIAALLSIQVYIKRGVQGRLKSSADDIGDQFSVGNTNVVKATVTISNTTDSFGLASDGTTIKQGLSRTSLRANEQTNTTEKSLILQQDQEYWGK